MTSLCSSAPHPRALNTSCQIELSFIKMIYYDQDMTSLCSNASRPFPTLCILSHATHTYESRHMRMSYVTYEIVLSIKSLHHVWMRHVRYDWVTSRMTAVAVQFITRHCKTLQHTARHCKTLQHTTAHMAEWHRVWMSRVAHGEIHVARELGPFIGLFRHVQVFFGISSYLRTGNSVKHVSMCRGLFWGLFSRV